MITFLILTLITISFGRQQTSLQTVEWGAVTTGNNEIRALKVTQDLTENSLTVGGLKLTLEDQSSDDTSASLNLDVGGFKFLGGKLGVQEPVLGFSALSATANVDWTKDGSGKVIFDIQGAWAEIIVGLSTIFLYEERSTEEGFQYTLGGDVWGCPVTGTTDCIILDSLINLKENITYSPLTVTSTSCADVGLTGYSPNCTIFQISSIGNLNTSPVITITLTLASQKVIIGPVVNNNQIGPDFAKVDFTINYPWTAKNQDGVKDKAHIGMAIYGAGKAGTAAVTGGTLNGKSAYLWYTDKTRAAAWSWDGQAEITTTNGVTPATAYAVGISGQSIEDVQYPVCTDITLSCIVNNLVILSWKNAVGWAKAFGWTTEIIVLSWHGAGANEVYYDPGIGMTSTESSGMLLAPTLLYFAWVLVHYFY
jgi:hypothetical protein